MWFTILLMIAAAIGGYRAAYCRPTTVRFRNGGILETSNRDILEECIMHGSIPVPKGTTPEPPEDTADADDDDDESVIPCDYCGAHKLGLVAAIDGDHHVHCSSCGRFYWRYADGSFNEGC